jgi:hypothetical protein
MDRRRFVPSAEGLEGRALLATSLFGTKPPGSNPISEVPATFVLKEHRVAQLPHYMEGIRSGRFLPPATIKKLQADLLAVTTKLHAPGSAVLDGFNSRLRAVVSKISLSADAARGLNFSFNQVVKAAGGTPEAVANLSDDMNALARNDSNSPQPVFLATNDYTMVLQTILGIGRPIRRPESAQLAARNGKRLGRNFGVTPKDQPTVVGTYDAFAQIQVVNAHGDVFGTGFVEKTGATQSNGVAEANGKYAVTINRPLSNGVHTFFIRAIDPYGNLSHPSPPFKIRVNTHLAHHTSTKAVPGGPLAV